MWPDNKDLEYQAQVSVGKEELWMVLDQISNKAKESTAANSGVVRKGETSQGYSRKRKVSVAAWK